jgi:hypothetical protein
MITRATLSTIEQGLPKYRSMLAGNNPYIPSVYESIASTTLSGVSQYTFTSIPSTYTHLQLRCFYRTTDATDSIEMRFNGDASGNYARTMMYWGSDIGVAAYQQPTGETTLRVANGAATGDYYAVMIIDIQNYAKTNQVKSFRSIQGKSTNNTEIDRISFGAGIWNNTAAISSINLACGGTSFQANTVLALYGIKD